MFEEKILTLAEAKLDGDGPGRLSGYASVFGGIDSYGDTIVPGAYKATIPQFLKDGFIPWGHDWAGYPVATPDKAREDGHGLWVEAVFHTDAESQRARQLVAERLDRGKSMGLSIGYQAKSFDFTEIDGRQVRRLTEIDLMEVSLVMVPADGAARVSAVKARRRLSRGQIEAVITTLQALLGDDDPDTEEIEALAGDAGAEGGKGESLDLPPSDAPLDLAGAKLADDLMAYVGRLRTADADEQVAAKDAVAGLIRRLSSARVDLDLLLKRAEDAALSDPRALRAISERLIGLYGPVHSGRRAG